MYFEMYKNNEWEVINLLPIFYIIKKNFYLYSEIKSNLFDVIY